MLSKKSKHKLQTNCHTCALTQFCLPVGLNEDELQVLEAMVNQRKQLARGETLKKAGDPFQNFYAIRSGIVKSATLNAKGEECIFGFYLPGEIVGFEAISIKKYPYDVIALTETLVCEIPFAALMSMANTHAGLQHQLLTLASQRLTNNNCIHFTSAQQKVVAFLLNISERLNNKLDLRYVFDLPMSRQDIGNHLGLAMETISRILSHLQMKGLLTIQHRTIEFIKPVELRAMAAGQK